MAGVISHRGLGGCAAGCTEGCKEVGCEATLDGCRGGGAPEKGDAVVGGDALDGDALLADGWLGGGGGRFCGDEDGGGV